MIHNSAPHFLVERLLRSYHFLQKSRTGVWYFRIRVPRLFRSLLGRSEIRRSLMTRDVREARPEARLLSVYAARLFSTLRRVSSEQRQLKSGLENMTRELMHLNIVIPTPNGPLEVRADPRIEGDIEGAQAALKQLFPNGIPLPEPGATRANRYDQSKRLSDVLERLKKHRVNRDISDSTLSEYVSVINEFIQRTGDLHIGEIRGSHISNFTHFLLNERKPVVTPRTVDKKLNALNALFAQAAADGDWDKKQDYPTVGHFRFKKKRRAHGATVENGYRPFSDDELRKLFDPMHFLKNAKEPADYWFPILGLLTGARINEIAQLLVSDVKRHKGVWIIHITDDGHQMKRVKTDSGRRMIPLHPKLIDLGFLDYVESVGEFGSSSIPASGFLFPYLTYSEKNGFGGAQSKRFGRYLSRIKLEDPQLVFHSLRKNFNQDLLNRQVHEEHRSRLMGHAYDSVNSEVYGTDLPLDQVLKDFIAPNVAVAIDVDALKMDTKKFTDQLLMLLTDQIKKQERKGRLAARGASYVSKKRMRIPTT